MKFCFINYGTIVVAVLIFLHCILLESKILVVNNKYLNTCIMLIMNDYGNKIEE